MEKKRIIEALTFDDVLLVPARADFSHPDIDTASRFTRQISLHTPFVSAAMDTVTEARLAITMAREGGIVIIPKGMRV